MRAILFHLWRSHAAELIEEQRAQIAPEDCTGRLQRNIAPEHRSGIWRELVGNCAK
jgi:hypothetical protein